MKAPPWQTEVWFENWGLSPGRWERGNALASIVLLGRSRRPETRSQPMLLAQTKSSHRERESAWQTRTRGSLRQSQLTVTSARNTFVILRLSYPRTMIRASDVVRCPPLKIAGVGCARFPTFLCA